MEDNLAGYLKELYPEADEDMVNYYLSIISDHEEEKLPPTKEMKELVTADKELKKLEEKVARLKKTILEQRKILGHKFQLVNITHVVGKKFEPDKFYDWVSTLMSKRRLNEITIKSIDEKKFFLLESQGIVSYDYIPKDCYSDTEQWRIAVSRSKQTNDDLSL